MAYQWNELEKTGNKVTSFSATPNDTNYPTEKLVKDTFDKLEEDIAEGNIVVAQATNATNTILNADGTHSAFTMDANGVLKVGNIVIPQRERLNSVKHTATDIYGVDISLNTTIKAGDIIEICWGTGTNRDLYYTKVKVYPDATSVGQSVDFMNDVQASLVENEYNIHTTQISGSLTKNKLHIRCPNYTNLTINTTNKVITRIQSSAGGNMTVYHVDKIIE